jgi:arylsulfatase A-like enzyme
MWPWATQARDAEELYDLQSDPYEMTNLARRPDCESVRADLARQLERWMVDTGDPLLNGPVPAPPGARVNPPDRLGSA